MDYLQQLLQLLTGADRQAPVGLKGLAAGGPPPGPRAPSPSTPAGNLPMFISPGQVNQSLGMTPPTPPPMSGGTSFGMDGAPRRMAPGAAMQPNTMTMHDNGARTRFVMDESMGPPPQRPAAPPPPYATSRPSDSIMGEGIMSGMTPAKMASRVPRLDPVASYDAAPIPTPKLPPIAVPPTRGVGSMLDGNWGPGQGARSGPGFEFGGMSSASSPTPSTHRPTPGFEFGGMGGGSPSAPPAPSSAPSPAPSPSPGAGGPYTVQQGDMAYNIAKQILGPNAGHSQLMAFVDALAQANPEAFYGDNKLRAGATLNTNLPPPGPRAAPMGTQGPAPMAGPQASGPAPRGMGRFAPM